MRKIIKLILGIILFPFLYPLKYVFPVLIFLLFYVTVSRTWKNFTGAYTFEKGIIVDIAEGTEREGGDSGRNVPFIIKSKKGTLLGYINIDQVPASMGDTVEFKNFNDGNISIYKRNGIKFGSEYGFWDYFSPFMVMVLGWFAYHLYILPFYLKHFQKNEKK